MGASKCYFKEGWRGGGGVIMPPELCGAARQPAALSARSCEDGDTCSPPPLSCTVDNTSSTTNGGGLHPGGEAGVAPSATLVVHTYRLTPKLKAAFASVGATDSAYSFREVLLLLKKYLFSNAHLFDPIDRLYVNCESDPLGKALGVERFHFNDVKSLISQNIIKVPRASHQPPSTPTPDDSSSSVCLDRSNDTTCRLPVLPGAVPCIPVNGIVTSQVVQRSPHCIPTTNPEPGPSRTCDKDQTLRRQGSPPPPLPYPDIPDSCSDTETVYSVQGDSTEYCHDTEFEVSEEDLSEVNGETFEEYELPSDDAKDEKEFSDSDSTIDDVEIAMLTYSLVQDDLEEGFWADEDSDTDTEHSDEDNDPECVSDRWDCLTCGLKNKPFVRYCGKCWQLRKNWLPDRPKKRKRKPRPKKRTPRKEMATSSSKEESTSQTKSCWECHMTPQGSAEESSQDNGLVRTSSFSTTSSSTTQDSGISSQDLLESQDLPGEFSKESCDERTLNQATTSKEPSQAEKQALEDTVQPKIDIRKRKTSSTDIMPSKRSKRMSADEMQVPYGDAETLAREMFNFMRTSKGKTWLSSSEGARFTRSLRATPAYQASLTQNIAEQISASTPGFASGISVLCSICCLRPKNASIIHGRISHQATCYQCARRLFNDGARCPVCRRKIHMILLLFAYIDVISISTFFVEFARNDCSQLKS